MSRENDRFLAEAKARAAALQKNSKEFIDRVDRGEYDKSFVGETSESQTARFEVKTRKVLFLENNELPTDFSRLWEEIDGFVLHTIYYHKIKTPWGWGWSPMPDIAGRTIWISPNKLGPAP